MEINHKISVDVPAAFVFSRLTDVESITSNLPSNVVLRAETDHSKFEVGSRWVVRAQRTGRKFAIHTEVLNVTDGKTLGFKTFSNRIESLSSVSIDEVSSASSIIEFDSKVSPKGLLGRILLQSLKASRRRLNERLETSGDKIKKYLEEAYKAEKGVTNRGTVNFL